MKNLAVLAVLAALPSLPSPPDDPAPLRAAYLTTTTDDFVVEVYHNGVRVPDAARKLLVELFGATAETISVAVRRGDWLVFHVVQNRMRWNGAKFFAVAGCAAPNEITFASDPTSPQWSACDDPARVHDFIARKDAGTEVRASAIDDRQLWAHGYQVIRDYAGAAFAGKALWGGAPSTWIKYVAD